MTTGTLETILITGAITALLTYFVTSLTQKAVIKSIVESAILVHEKIHHNQDTNKRLSDHIINCTAIKKVDKIERALIYIVSNLGGNPKELGLIDL